MSDMAKQIPYQEIYDEAYAAGVAAVAAKVPVPMIVGTPTTPLGNDIDPSKTVYYVADGVCGFAWVWFPANTGWGRWAKKNIGQTEYHAACRRGYPNGLDIWVTTGNQSMEKKQAFAQAFAGVLQSYGIDAYAASRED